MFLALIKLRPIPGRREEIVELLRSLQKHATLMSACRDCLILEERGGEEAAILYLERWESRTALNRHVQSRRYLQLLYAMDLADKPPEISFCEVYGETGQGCILASRRA